MHSFVPGVPGRRALMLVLCLFAVIAVMSPHHAAALPLVSNPGGSAGEVIVRFAPHAEFNAAARGVAHLRAGGVRARGLRGMPGYDLVVVPRGSSATELMRRYHGDPSVLYAEPNYPVAIAITPDDPRFGEQWALENTGQNRGTPGADIGAREAWSVTTGDPDVLVAVIDTGVDYNHPDLAPNIWSGLGWNFAEDNADPMDIHGHGTHVAGTIAAVGNNGVGVAGVSWEASVMALKALSNSGSGWMSDIAEAVTYASVNGADVINMSLGSSYYSQTLYDAIAASSAVVVCAAGNDGRDTDLSPTYPASYELDNIISVAATDRVDALAHFSNYGVASADLGAPGVSILSALPGATYTSATVFADSMTSLDAWDTGEYRYHPWALSTTHFASEPGSAGHAPLAGYEPGERSWLVMRDPVALSAADRVKIRFKARLDVVSPDDWLIVAAQPENGDWYAVGYVSGSTGGAFWSFEGEVSELAGTNARLAFGFFSGDSGGGAGVWVDDVEVNALSRDDAADYSDAYGLKSGTSMAAPHVAGVAALVKAHAPQLDPGDLKAAILDSAEPIDALSGKTVTGGRLDAPAALASVVPPNSPPVARDVTYVAETGSELVVAAPGVLINDTDDDGDTLAAELVTDAIRGELALSPDGSFLYRPSERYFGTDSFSYRAFDGSEYSAAATVYIEVLDTVAPVSTAHIEPETPDGAAGWYTSKPGISITATDVAGSGVVWIEWKLSSDAGWTRSDGEGATVDGIGDGAYTLSYRAADAAGNVEEVRTAEIKVDTTAPVTTSDSEPTYSDTATISLDAADGASGVAATYYRLGDGGVFEYSEPLFVDELGAHTIHFWSVDLAGNVEEVRSAVFEVLDTVAPVSTAHIEPGTPDGAAGWYTSKPGISITATDVAGSGVAWIEWKLSPDGGWTRSDGEVATVDGIGDGAHTLSYRAADAAGNIEEVRTAEIKVDTTAPDGTIAIDGGAAYTNATTVTVVHSPAWGPSGLGRMRHSTDGGASWTAWEPYSATKLLTLSGTHGTRTVRVEFENGAGVTSTAPIAASIYLDTVAPQPPSVTAEPDGWGNLIVTWNAVNDTGSGVASYRLYQDGESVYYTETPSSEYTRFFTALSGGTTYAFKVLATDKAGNSTDSATVSATPHFAFAGDTRYHTAIDTARTAFPEGATTVILATGANFPDALAAAPLAGILDAPILLVPASISTASRISGLEATLAYASSELGATKAIVLGGDLAINADVYSRIESRFGPSNVTRIAGDTRYDTANAIIDRALGEMQAAGEPFAGTAFLATGANFPDALAAAPLSASNGWPVFLTRGTTFTTATRDAMKKAGVNKVVVLGGEFAIDKKTYDAVAKEFGASNVTRIAGGTRYATAAKIATLAVEGSITETSRIGVSVPIKHSWDRVGITTGLNFPDALAGGMLQAKAYPGRGRSVTLLTSPTSLSKATAETLELHKGSIDVVTFYGGQLALNQAVRTSVLQTIE